ncbi:MAG: SIMPL domain-containing protein [Candidatus Eremiobacteraeota bacterium]|nr:SIMPL domain-containing protein [Candidatus Eremiobacteraeota bacterium]
MRSFLLRVFVGAVALALSMPISADADAQSPPPHTISVTAAGTVEFEPDIATVNVGTRTEAPAPDAAIAGVAETAARLLKALHDLGIDNRSIKTAQYQLQYQPATTCGTPHAADYVATETVEVSRIPIHAVGGVIAASVQAGANQVYGPIYDSTRRAQLQDQALTKALAAAQSEAQKIAAHSGVRLAGLYSLTVVNPWSGSDGSWAQAIPPPGLRSLANVTVSSSAFNAGLGKFSMTVQAVYEVK